MQVLSDFYMFHLVPMKILFFIKKEFFEFAVTLFILMNLMFDSGVIFNVGRNLMLITLWG